MVDKLNEILDSHALWLNSQRSQGHQAILTNMDLRFADLTGRDLREAVLTGANFERASLGAAQLTGADLQNANLCYADLHDASIENTNLTRAKLEGANLAGARLDFSNLEEASLESASLRSATLVGIKGRGAKFSRANLALCALNDAKLQDAVFTSADLTQASLSDAELTNACLRKAILSGADLDGANLKNADMEDAVLVGASLEKSPQEAVKEGAEAEASGLLGFRRKRKKGSLPQPSGIAAERHDELSKLTRRAEELRAAMRALPASERNSGTGERAMLERNLSVIETKRRLTAMEIRREQERIEAVQEQIGLRVDHATQSLRSALDATNRVIRASRRWSTAYRATAFIVGGLSLLILYRFASSGLAERGLVAQAPWLALLALFAATTFLAVWMDLKGAPALNAAVARREKIDDMIGLLRASQFISFDLERNLANVESTFTEIRKVLLSTAPVQAASGSPTEAR